MDPTTGPAPHESIDVVVRGLRELRGSVGDPSFAQIAQRITERRIARGLPPLGAALTGGLFTSVADKLISGVIALAAVSLLPAARHSSPGIRSADWGLWEVTRNGRIRLRAQT